MSSNNKNHPMQPVVGYSVSGAGGLEMFSDEVYEKAMQESEALSDAKS